MNSVTLSTILQTSKPRYIICANQNCWRLEHAIENYYWLERGKCQDHWRWTLFYFLFSLYFTFLFLFSFLFLEQLGLGFISHAVTSVTIWWRSHKTDHKTWEKEVEGSRTKWRHTAWTTHVSLMLYSWSFRVGCTVANTDHEE